MPQLPTAPTGAPAEDLRSLLRLGHRGELPALVAVLAERRDTGTGR